MTKDQRHQSRSEDVALCFGPDEDDSERIQRTVFLPPNFPYAELIIVGEMLEAENVFVPGYKAPPVGICVPDAFIFEAEFEDIRTILLPDRNIVSRMAQLVAGAPTTELLQKIAAIKAFCHFLDIQIEPSIAFHELAQIQGNDAANIELARFQDADNADPYPWLDLAFGDLDALTTEPEHPIKSLDLSFPLRRWRLNYIVALKIAELELSSRPNLTRMLDLLSWMGRESMIAGPAALLACIYFAPNSPPRKNFFKQLRSPERRRAIDGVRNEAWDLTHLSDLVRRVNDANGSRSRLIFASFDRGLRDLAALLFTVSDDGFVEELLVEAISPWWSRAHAAQIGESLADLLVDLNKPSCYEERGNSPLLIDEMIAKGEQMLLTARGI